MIGPHVIPQLKRHAELGNLVLFTGAGFSRGLTNTLGENLPDSDTLAQIIWSEFYPNDAFDPASTLADVYDAALTLNASKLKDLVARQLTIDSSKTPGWLVRYFTFPWNKVYTLNIDSTVGAINKAVHPPRPLVQISCTAEQQPPTSTKVLPVYCLNGTIDDLPHKVTFGFTQYSKRLTQGDQSYMQLSAEILSNPFVYIGTKLNESSLWQHIELRKDKGGRDFLEMRPRGYLVTPSLDKPKQLRLKGFNIEWIPMTGEEFSDQVLAQLEEAKSVGINFLMSDAGKDVSFGYVRDLLQQKPATTDFLLGEEPSWCDITSNRAIIRTVDEEIDAQIASIVSDRTGSRKGLISLVGTAGSGKSTTMMRLGASASARGERCLWLDRNTSSDINSILDDVSSLQANPEIVFVDDADGFGFGLVSFLGELSDILPDTLIVFAIRSGVYDKLVRRKAFGPGVPYVERTMPPLSDCDIDKLIEKLTQEKRLGKLRGESIERQRRIFKDYSGKQLLVAMLSATLGEKFEDKVLEEYNQMDKDMRRAYCVLAIATAYRCSLSRADVVAAVRDWDNELLNAFESLVRRHLIVEDRTRPLYYKVRHRVIAERLMGEIHAQGHFISAMVGLAAHAALSENPETIRKTAKGRMLIALINHETLRRHMSNEECEQAYGELEVNMENYYHYWLQRGSLAVKADKLPQAENFLSQARGIYVGLNSLIENEYAYMLFKKACARPGDHDAVGYVEEAQAILEALMNHPYRTPHPFHVYGSQGLAWLNRGINDPETQKEYISRLIINVERGINDFPHNAELAKLIRDLKRRYYEMGLTNTPPSEDGEPIEGE